MKKLRLIVLFAMALLLSIGQVTAQGIYEVKSHSLTIEGTSNLHDWTANVGDVKGLFNLKVEDGKITGIDKLTVKIGAESLRGSKGSIMDSKINEALNSKKHPEISYELRRVNSITENAGVFRLNTTGVLKISGVSRNVNLTATGKIVKGGEIEFTGNTKLKMSDYSVKPPTAMFGALTTGDEITLNYKVIVSPSLVTNK
jgi:polyisoprenoid-binding protein YceI